MTEQEIHDWIQLKLKDPRQISQAKPAEFSKEKWKNRHKVSAKLTKDTYAYFMRWCRVHDLTVNQAINVILSFFLNKVSIK